MKLTASDWGILRGAFFSLGIAIFCALALVIGSHQYRLALENERANAERSVSAARMQLSNAKKQDTQYTSNKVLYGAVAKRGLFDAERRLEWIDKVSQLREKHRLFSVDYDISPQGPFDSRGLDLAARASKVNLKIAALHEQDLANFLADLKTEAPGIFLLDACALERKSTSEATELAPQIFADCTMQWLTVKAKH